MPSDREALLVTKRMKFPVPSADGTRLEDRVFQPGEFLPRQAWDLAPARSRRTLTNTGFVRDSLNVEINQITGREESVPVSKPATTVYLPATTVKRRGTDGHEYDKVIHGVDPNAGREPNKTPPKAGTRRNRKVWGDQPEPTAQRPVPVAGTRLNPKVWGAQVATQTAVSSEVLAPKRRGRPRKSAR